MEWGLLVIMLVVFRLWVIVGRTHDDVTRIRQILSKRHE